jgi:hypothetical protein
MIGFLLFGIGLNGVVEGVSNRAPKTVSISQFETQMPTAGWYHITGAQLDTAHAIVLNGYGDRAGYGDTPSTIVAPLVGPNDATGAPVKVFLRTSDPTLVAEAGQRGALPSVDVTGMIALSLSRSESIAFGEDVGDSPILDDGREPGSILGSLGMMIGGIVLIILGFALYLGLHIPFLDGPGYEWSAENYKEKPTAKYPQSNRGPAYPPQGSFPQPNYPPQGSYPPHGQMGQPQPSSEEAQPKMRTLE